MSDQFIGVDVGGTKIAICKLQDGQFSDSDITHTEQSSQEALVEQLAARLEAVIGPDTKAIGITSNATLSAAARATSASVAGPIQRCGVARDW